MTAYDFALKCMDIAQNVKTIYVMGCLGYPMTRSYKDRMYNHHEYNRRENKWKHINAAESDRFGFDCVCFIKSIIWGWDGNLKDGGITYQSNNLPDIGANSMMTGSYCSDISEDMNNVQTGEILWCEGHVGVYLGCDRVAECTPSWRNCVQISTLRESVTGYGRQNWRKHGKLKVLEYDGRQITNVPGIVCKSDASNLASGSSASVSGSAGTSVNTSNTSTSTSVFRPRLTDADEPAEDDPHWIHTSCGGLNPCIKRWGNSVLPNCVGYAWGRFMEILGTAPKLSTSNAEDWWGHTSDGYERGQIPQLGAVICWRKGVAGNGDDGPGHVAIVEAIHEDGSITISHSGYSAKTRWYTPTHRTNSNGNWGQASGYTFQGFIYNPGGGAGYLGCGGSTKDNLSYFIEAVNSKPSESDITTWIQNVKTKVSTEISNMWDTITDQSLKFVLGCATDVEGLIDVVIPSASSRAMIVETGTANKMGSWLSGPGNGFKRTPHPGDVIYVRTSNVGSRKKHYDCDRIGIVSTIKTEQKFDYTYMEGGTVSVSELEFDSTQIAGYYRAKWSLVGANILNQVGINLTLSIYNELSGKDDATVREIGYLNSKLEPSISPSNLKLSVINYTSGINALFLAWGGYGNGYGGPHMTFTDLSIEGFTSVQCSIIEQLMSYGLNAAIAIGILANMKHESNFRLDAVGDSGTSFGLCQWHLGRGDRMKAHCGGGDSWKSNLSGQVDFLWKELQSNEINAYNHLKNCPNTLQGCRDAAYNFCVYFERCANKWQVGYTRADTAEKYWATAVVTLLPGS